MSNEKRHEIFFIITGVAALLVAFLVSGWQTEPLDLTVGLIIVTVGSLVAGMVTGENMTNKLYHTLAAMITSAGVVVTTVWYLSGRSSVWNYELLVPIGLGGIPGIIAYFLFRHLEPKPQARVLAALAFGGGLIFFMSQAIPTTEQGISEQEKIIAENMPAIPIPPDARSVIRSQFGKPAEELLRQIDIVNSLLEVYKIESVAGDTKAISKLEKSLESFVEFAGQQEDGQKLQTASDFRSYRDVVGITRVFIDETRALAGDSQ